ncbi:MAG TPA: hypothetical protein VN496_03230 [Burkholderiales bacterium]|nr:hypothetical protein [Burkholderiales bacterium]
MAFAKLLPLFFRQCLVFTPTLVQLLVLLWWKLFHAFVALDSLRALFRRQGDPFMHTLLNPLPALGR